MQFPKFLGVQKFLYLNRKHKLLKIILLERLQLSLVILETKQKKKRWYLHMKSRGPLQQ